MSPVLEQMGSYGFCSLDSQNLISFSEASDEEKPWLNAYARLRYNALSDREHRDRVLFSAPEIVSAE